LRLTAFSDEPPSVEDERPSDDDEDEPLSPPLLVAVTMMTMRAMTARRMKRFFL
jgi:hypothetical protein